jgi:hypothetical protein
MISVGIGKILDVGARIRKNQTPRNAHQALLFKPPMVVTNIVSRITPGMRTDENSLTIGQS